MWDSAGPRHGSPGTRRARWWRWQRTRLFATASALLVLLAGVMSAAVVLEPATAYGATGTLTVTAGTLTLTSPTSLAWSATLAGVDQSVVDTTAADQQLTVTDATGSGAGWKVTISATTFTTAAPVHTLADTGTFATTGSVSSVSATTSPTSACATGAKCTLPTLQTGFSYPVAITTAATSPTPVTMYDTAVNSGLGRILLGGSTAANPLGWWVNLPANTLAGSYTSTVTLAVASGP